MTPPERTSAPPVAGPAHNALSSISLVEAMNTARGLREALSSGRALSITHPTEGLVQSMSKLTPVCEEAGIANRPRSAGQVRALLGRWNAQSQGVVPTELHGPGYGDVAQRLPDNARDQRSSCAAIALKFG
ncbi:hypothetical protein [Streptomyces cyaneofuscatus]|uniref:hypothetical protein n=1 Tax=Streptomyces cyaneofuscatus TaxID=66883 RepID=UPI003812F3B2